MSGYYNLDVVSLQKKRKSSEVQPFPHQQAAFSTLTDTLPIPMDGYRGTLLVLPTGGGKTYTSINWICRNVLSKGIKVLWLAQSSYLIDQAADTFIREIHNATGREFINLRVVSSSTSHANSGSISLTDDVLVCTTQTAISAYSSEPLDGQGNIARTPFWKFINSCTDSQLFVVVDEAHHTPAYGCRNLLLSMRNDVANLYILGLTATPMHMDKRISGWLQKIYDKWICYEADKSMLQANKILSVPKYIEKDTGMEFEVDDGLFDRLVNKHKDLPDSIIEHLANNQARNNLIVSDYVNNRSDYGKTLIFADRWFQCEYLVEKLKEQGVKANAVYSVVTGQDSNYRRGTGRRNNKHNEEIMDDFRNTNKYDVIVNVKMLTEGVDVPDVKTVMITRQTTSNILLTQMIGRALRGEKAGGGEGKDYANIVFFHDTWKRLLPWADVQGGVDDKQPVKQRRNPMKLISTHLIKLAAADITYKGFEDADYLTFVPIGFFNCEYTIAVEDDGHEELVSFEENTVAYEFNKDKYDTMIEHLKTQDLSKYENENTTESQIEEMAKEMADVYFEMETDGFDGELINNIIKIIHHMAQNNTKPVFIDFQRRNEYDMDAIARNLLRVSPLETDLILTNKFNNEGMHWGVFYETFDNFMDAYYKSQKRELIKIRGKSVEVKELPVYNESEELTEQQRYEVFIRDSFTCLCCGKKRSKGVSLSIDHIRPVFMDGSNALSNLQSLCMQCNRDKGKNEIDFRVNKTPLRIPKAKLQTFVSAQSDGFKNAIARVVNMFYHCRAMSNLLSHKRKSGQYYSTWEVVLYSGNDPEWLRKHEAVLFDYVKNHLGQSQVTEILVRN